MQRLQIETFGFPSVRLEDRRVELALRKGLALLVYLADRQAAVSREAAAALLWPDADREASMARLRRTLHRVRLAFGQEIIVADRVALQVSQHLSVTVNSVLFDRCCDEGRLEQAVDLYRGEFLSGFSLHDCPEFEDWAFFRREALRSRLVQILERLIARRISEGATHEAVAHATRVVALDPFSESAHRHLIQAHLAAGDRMAAERQFEALSRLLREELDVGPEPATASILERQTPSPQADLLRTRYTEVQGIHIAYRALGRGPVDVVVVPGFISHVERVWDDPRCRAWLETVSGAARLILFDRRGVGLSDRIGPAPTTEATSQDIHAVLNAVGSRRALLVGASEGGPGCIRFAAEHPDRLLGLILWASLAKGSRSADYPHALTPAQYDLWRARLIRDWGGPAEMKTFAPSLVGDRRAEAWWAGMLRSASSPGALKGVLDALREVDVRDLLPRIEAPTVVLHRRGDRAVRVEAGRHLADNIPGARFIELDGEDHWFWAGDQKPLTDLILSWPAG